MPRYTAMISTTKAPSAPASVGVAQPVYIALKMIATTATIGSVPGTVAHCSRRGGDLIGRPSSGFNLHCPMIRAA